MNIIDLMYKASSNKAKVKAVCGSKGEYIGVASNFSNRENEEDGFATFIIKTNHGLMCLGENEITELTILD